MDFSAFSNLLDRHQPIDATEQAHWHRVREFVSANRARFWQRSTLEGHVTGSAFVVDRSQQFTLLLHHAKLNRWVQPGGHLDDSDDSPAAGALREALEETGIAGLALKDGALFDLDVHPIPERNKSGEHEPSHFHYDARYLVIAPTDHVSISDESLGFRWVALRELAGGASEKRESGLVRMAKKALLRA
jgi:8-oxo-dGTP pyrophosphatase MutT (NUDIX family)